MAAARGQIAWTRLIMPTIICGAALLVANGMVPKPLAIAFITVLDFALVGLCVAVVGESRRARILPMEERLERAFLRFFPEWLARLMSRDIAMVLHAPSGLRAFLAGSDCAATTYAQGSKVAMLACIVAISIIPDAALFWLLIPHRYWPVSLALDVLDVWAALWLFGIYGCMAARPHLINGTRIQLNNGLLQSVEFDADCIEGAKVLGLVKRRDLRRKRGDGSTVLAFGGVPLVEVHLNAPAMEHNMLSARPRPVTRIFVASCRPEQLVSVLVAKDNHGVSTPACPA